MKNETKRDVFNDALTYVPVGNEYDPASDDEAGDLRSLLSERYSEALSDDLQVIPKEVGEILQSAHCQTNLLDVLDTAKIGYKVSDTLEWIYSNQNAFARAWLDGYAVEDNA